LSYTVVNYDAKLRAEQQRGWNVSVSSLEVSAGKGVLSVSEKRQDYLILIFRV